MIKAAVIGVGSRGEYNLRYLLPHLKNLSIVSVCDSEEDRAQKGAQIVRETGKGDPAAFTDYKDALNVAGLDAVFVFTSWETHTPIALYAMEKGIAVGSEVGSECDLENCWELVRTQERTGTPYMFLENCCYDRAELLATSMARAGLFGTVVHCEGAYAHDLRHEVAYGIRNRHYRFRHYKNRCLENYPTHDLGPIARLLGVNRGNRMMTLTSMACRQAGLEEYIASRDDLPADIKATRFAQGDIIDTMIRCAGGETIHLRLDTTLPRFYNRNFTVRGTKGSYWAATNMVFIDGVTPESWEPAKLIGQCLNNAEEYAETYLPHIWKDVTPEAMAAGHGGMDYFCYGAFLDALENRTPMPIDVYDGAAWMAVSVLSEQSIMLGSKPVEVPDFTRGSYLTRKNEDVTEF